MNIKINDLYTHKPTLREILRILNVSGEIFIVTHTHKILTASCSKNTLVIDETDIDSSELAVATKDLLDTAVETISIKEVTDKQDGEVCIYLTNQVIVDYINRTRRA